MHQNRGILHSDSITMRNRWVLASGTLLQQVRLAAGSFLVAPAELRLLHFWGFGGGACRPQLVGDHFAELRERSDSLPRPQSTSQGPTSHCQPVSAPRTMGYPGFSSANLCPVSSMFEGGAMRFGCFTP